MIVNFKYSINHFGGLWPSVFDYMYFDSHNDEFVFEEEITPNPSVLICTRNDFESEVAIQKKLLNIWDGKDIPPISVECEYMVGGGINWFKCKVIAHEDNLIWINNLDTGSKPLKRITEVKFRQLNHNKDRDEWVEKALLLDVYTDSLNNGGMMSRTDYTKAIYDAQKSGELPQVKQE